MKTAQLITQYFEADHSRLDALFKKFQKISKKSMAEAKPFFKTFNNGLKRHIVWEEDVLFPVFEKKSGSKEGGPTFVMREEHRKIGALLERIHASVRKGIQVSEQDENEMLQVLGAHNRKEEQIIYPAIDHDLSEEEAAEAFLAMESIPPERYQTCCGGHH